MLDGRVVVVTAGGSNVAGSVVAGLERAGAVVHQVDGRFASCTEADEAFAAALRIHGRVDVVVHASIQDGALEPIPFVDVDERRWSAIWEATMLASIACCQAAFPLLRESGGRLIFVTPAIATTGAAGLAAYATAAEGQRLLAKSAARQWQGFGIGVGFVVHPFDELHRRLADAVVFLAGSGAASVEL